MPAAEESALTPELLTQIRRLEIRTRRLATASVAGNYRSVFRGSGIEFAEAREYVPGDDIRLIDWNVTARMGGLWVKKYVEERELHVVCAVDISASQLTGRPAGGRLEAAASVCALLSFAAAYSQDRTGLLTFSDRVERFIPPARGTRHALRLVREVLRHPEPEPGTSIATACDYLSRVLRRRSIVCVISDFFDRGFEESLRSLARRHEVIAVTLIDPTDLELPDVGLVEVEDIERGGRVLLDTADARTRERYAEAATHRAAERRDVLARAAVDEIEVRLDRDHTEPLVSYFRQRAQRR